MNITRSIRLEIVPPERYENLHKEYHLSRFKSLALSKGETIKDIENSLKSAAIVTYRLCNLLSSELFCRTIDPGSNRQCVDYRGFAQNGISIKLKEWESAIVKEINENPKIKGKINHMPSDIRGYVCTLVSKSNYYEHFSEIKYGKRSAPSFRQKTANVGMFGSINSNGTAIGYSFFRIQDNNEYYVYWRGIWFKTMMGKDSQGNRAIIEHILNKDAGYKQSDSFLEVGKKIIMKLSVKIPISKNLFDKSKIMGIDLGINNPAAVAICDKATGEVITDEYTAKPLTKIFDGQEFIARYDGKFETYNLTPSFVNLRKACKIHEAKIKASCLYTGNSGHGRQSKMEKYYNAAGKERANVTNYFHNLSRQIINYARHNNCGEIHMEDLSGIGNNDSILSKTWGYYQLQSMIEYKSKKEGMKVRYVDPKNTSKTCSSCGYIYNKDDWSTSIHEWSCPICGAVHNRDINAAVNIARAQEIKKDEEDLQDK